MHLNNTPRGYELNKQEALFSIAAPLPYAYRHFKAAKETDSFIGKLGHYSVALIQLIPLLGHIAAVIEVIAVKILLHYNLINPGSTNNQPPTEIEEKQTPQEPEITKPTTPACQETQLRTPAQPSEPPKPVDSSPAHKMQNQTPIQPSKEPAPVPKPTKQLSSRVTAPRLEIMQNLKPAIASSSSFPSITSITLGATTIAALALAGYTAYSYFNQEQTNGHADSLEALSSSALMIPGRKDVSVINSIIDTAQNFIEHVGKCIANNTLKLPSPISYLKLPMPSSYAAVTQYDPTQNTCPHVEQPTSNLFSFAFNVIKSSASIFDNIKNLFQPVVVNENHSQSVLTGAFNSVYDLFDPHKVEQGNFGPAMEPTSFPLYSSSRDLTYYTSNEVESVQSIVMQNSNTREIGLYDVLVKMVNFFGPQIPRILSEIFSFNFAQDPSKEISAPTIEPFYSQLQLPYEESYLDIFNKYSPAIAINSIFAFLGLAKKCHRASAQVEEVNLLQRKPRYGINGKRLQASTG